MGSRSAKRKNSAQALDEISPRLTEKEKSLCRNTMRISSKYREVPDFAREESLNNNPHRISLTLDTGTVGGGYTKGTLALMAKLGGKVYLTEGVRQELGREGVVSLVSKLETYNLRIGLLDSVEEPKDYRLLLKDPNTGKTYDLQIKRNDFRKVTPSNISFSRRGYEWDRTREVWQRQGISPPSMTDEELLRWGANMSQTAVEMGKNCTSIFISTLDRRHIIDSYLARQIEGESGIFFGTPPEIYRRVYDLATKRRSHTPTPSQQILAQLATTETSRKTFSKAKAMEYDPSENYSLPT